MAADDLADALTRPEFASDAKTPRPKQSGRAKLLRSGAALFKAELRAILSEILYGLIDHFCLPPNIVNHTCAIHGHTIRVIGKSGRICCYCHDLQSPTPGSLQAGPDVA